MADTAPTARFPEFNLPQFKFPKIDVDGWFAAQKANLAVVHEAQNVLVDAARAIATVQYDWTREAAAGAEAALRAKQPKQADAVVADYVAAVEKATAVTKETMELATVAQRRVVEQFARRVAANLDELKALAA